MVNDVANAPHSVLRLGLDHFSFSVSSVVLPVSRDTEVTDHAHRARIRYVDDVFTWIAIVLAFVSAMFVAVSAIAAHKQRTTLHSEPFWV